MTKDIYKKKPLAYRQWRQVRKEMFQLALVVAALVAVDEIIHYLAAYFFGK